MALHRGFKLQKPAKNLRKKICEIDWSHLCLQPFDKFQIYSACIHRKRKLCKSAEIDFGKIREITSGELIFGGFWSFETTVSQQQQQSSNYQCFRYERHYSEEKGGIVVKMAQSYSGACEGLWSAEEGDRTYTLWTGKK